MPTQLSVSDKVGQGRNINDLSMQKIPGSAETAVSVGLRFKSAQRVTFCSRFAVVGYPLAIFANRPQNYSFAAVLIGFATVWL